MSTEHGLLPIAVRRGATRAPPAPCLWVKSHYSFLEGASSPEELVEAAAAAGYTHIAITDRHNLYGTVRAFVHAQKCNITLLVGVEIDVHGTHPVVLLALDQPAYVALCGLINAAQLAAPKAHSHLNMELLCAALATSPALVCLCPHVALLAQLACATANAKEQIYALCARQRGYHEPAHELELMSAAKRLGLLCVAAVEVLYHVRARRALQDVLRCVKHRTTLALAGTKLCANAEHVLPTPEHLAHLFADRPQWLIAARNIALRADFGMRALRYRYPAGKLGAHNTPIAALRARTFAGAQRRFGARLPTDVVVQLERELKVVTELDYGGYFLSMEEIVQACMQRGILCQGRGSAANSLICYCLHITAINPLRMQLLFERFISQARAEAPDIDLDIEHQRREEIMQWVYARYGRDHAAMVANVVRFRSRSAARAMGQALGIPDDALTKISALLGTRGLEGGEGFVEPLELVARAREAKLDVVAPSVVHWLRLVPQMLDVPRHLSVHSGGFVLGDRPLTQLAPTEPATMPGRTVLPWDKHDIESLGLFKVDLLALGALSHVRRAFELVAKTEGRALSMATVPQEDKATYDMLCRGDAIGVFQIESRAQLNMLPRLRPQTFYDLVVEVAIVRPGPIQGEMVHPYLRQRARGVQPNYPHPVFAEVLGKTFGVPIFQEQVMKLAILAADYTPAEADTLRRDMAAWRSHRLLAAHHFRIVEGMIKKGIKRDFAERIFKQIRGFGEYGFPESHAASFAHIVYVTAYLRRHHLPAFVCALINSQPMGFYSTQTILEDAKRNGVVVRPLHVNHSAIDCTLEPIGLSPRHARAGRRPWPFAVRMGLGLVRGLSEADCELLRAAPRPFRSVAEVAARTGLNNAKLQVLVRAGACEGLPDRSHAAEVSSRPLQLWDALGMASAQHNTLLGTEQLASERPLIARLAEPLTREETVLWDVEASNHSARGHVLGYCRARLAAQQLATSQQVGAACHGRWVRCAGLVICRQRPETARGTMFITLEDEWGLINVIVAKEVVERYRMLVAQPQVLGVWGRIERQGEVLNVVAQELFDALDGQAHSRPRPMPLHPRTHAERAAAWVCSAPNNRATTEACSSSPASSSASPRPASLPARPS